MKTVPTFSERLKRRHYVWWDNKGWRSWGPGSFFRRAIRHSQLAIPRSHSHPLWLWQFQPLWQRCLNNKWNSREFAQMHGFNVPELYTYVRNLKSLDLSWLPDQYVVRPAFGKSQENVYVMDRDTDLLRDTKLRAGDLLRTLNQAYAGWNLFPLLLEEFVRSESGIYKLPVEYRCYAFNGRVAAISCDLRVNIDKLYRKEYYPDWTPVEKPLTKYPEGADSDAPKCLPEILRCAEVLSRAYGSFVRVDCYATDKGCVFGEFSSVPARGNKFTDFGDRFLSDFWQRYAPNAL